MGGNSLKITFSLLLLSLFLLGKGISYHPLSHTDEGDTEKCELCLFSVLSESVLYDTPTQEVEPSTVLNIPSQGLLEDRDEFLKVDIYFPSLFSRPPPAL
ncbi:MAG: hypothetical protein HKP23_06135 [Flavobacteriaceae bacterium]|nr:hypothetical protein [Eudoraea sp.]NNJ38805.1 hypothetical protein [Flavobacteriaceae bacterium]